jgi:membrane protease YdiL (CAAX protease family)
MTRPTEQPDWRIAHGMTFVLLMAGALAVPVLRPWPWFWLAPFVAYALLVVGMPCLRHSIWLRAGQISRESVVATMAVMAVSVAALIVFHFTARPDVDALRAAIPINALGGVITAGIVFCVLNATLEELVFRGVLFDALESKWGSWFTVAATSLLFGVAHAHGYPSGIIGVCMASLFGLVMGLLRLRTGGLVLPIAAHIVADATIYSILFYSGSE